VARHSDPASGRDLRARHDPQVQRRVGSSREIGAAALAWPAATLAAIGLAPCRPDRYLGAGGKAECLEIKVTGAREIEKILKEPGPTAANRIARSALNRSATPIVRRAKELVPVATGELKRATTRRQRRGSDKKY
jgi:hypothetical protein